jgi:hypothetical protein
MTNNNYDYYSVLYLRAGLNSQWPVTESATIQTAVAIRNTNSDQLRLFIFKPEILQTAFAAETHLAEGQWLKEQLNLVKLRMFRAGT